MACDCIKIVDEKLRPRNTRLVVTITLGAELNSFPSIRTEQIEKGRGRPKAIGMVPSFLSVLWRQIREGRIMSEPFNQHVGSSGKGIYFALCLRRFVPIVSLLREKGGAGFGSPSWIVLVGRRGKPKGLPSPCGLPTCVRPATRVDGVRDANSTLNRNEQAFPRGETRCQELYSRSTGWTTPCLHSKCSTTSSQVLLSKRLRAKSSPYSTVSLPTRFATAPRNCAAINDPSCGVAS